MSSPATDVGADCPACGGGEGSDVYAVDGVPVHDVRLHHTREDALRCARGDLRLRACPGCGLIWNSAFDPGLLDYGVDYESTQSDSPTFRRFHARLAQDLVDRFALEGGTVVEIGCGRGEFLELLREAGVARAVGYDPAVDPRDEDSVRILREPFPAGADLGAVDLLCCKMTLEHVAEGPGLLARIRHALGPDSGAAVFFQVPDVARILREAAFWDVYYEHCTYYSAGSLARLFRAAGFAVREVWREYGDQYLLLDARSAGEAGALPVEESPAEIVARAEAFGERAGVLRARWRAVLGSLARSGRRTVVWGGGSKAVAFLQAVAGGTDVVPQVVDVNPRKANTWLAGTGQPVVTPERLRREPPDVVIVMNPIYRDEIAAALAGDGLQPALATVEDPGPLEALAPE